MRPTDLRPQSPTRAHCAQSRAQDATSRGQWRSEPDAPAALAVGLTQQPEAAVLRTNGGEDYGSLVRAIPPHATSRYLTKTSRRRCARRDARNKESHTWQQDKRQVSNRTRTLGFCGEIAPCCRWLPGIAGGLIQRDVGAEENRDSLRGSVLSSRPRCVILLSCRLTQITRSSSSTRSRSVR